VSAGHAYRADGWCRHSACLRHIADEPDFGVCPDTHGDGKQGALLLQIFSENQLGPIFFEFIQRKGDEGFGEGNFKALFESIELDQMRRGVLQSA